jgi:hypothetical protein
VESSGTLPATAIYEFNIQAYGDVANGVWPNMELRMDGKTIASYTVNSKANKNYIIRTGLTAGMHKVTIAFTNEFFQCQPTARSQSLCSKP